MGWRWIARKTLISYYLLFHIVAVTIWVIPLCPIKQAWMPSFAWYMLPLGLWQSWSMFAPDPLRNTITLEAEVVDARGVRQIHAFQKVDGLAWYRKLPRFRHSKFAANLLVDEYTFQRMTTARHAVRTLGVDTVKFPVHVSLYYQVKSPPPPGVAAADPMARPRMQMLAVHDFETPDEVLR